MSFISTGAHQQFIRQFQSLLAGHIANEKFSGDDGDVELLKADLGKLQQIADIYKDTFSQLQDLAIEYKVVAKRTRLNMRRLQIKKNDNKVAVNK